VYTSGPAVTDKGFKSDSFYTLDARHRPCTQRFGLVVYPRIDSKDVDDLRLLACFGEAFPLAVPGVYYWCILMEDYVEELAP
jgi:hypothetical protein